MDTFLHSAGRGVGELVASLDHAGMTLTLDALPGPHTCVAERRGASRALSLSPAVDETPTPAPMHTARVVYGARGLLLTRACPSLENVSRLSCRVTRTGRGHRYVSRSQRTHVSLPAIVVHTAIEPQEVFGAAMCGLRHAVAMKSEHVARG